jgi:hypothetical protein
MINVRVSVPMLRDDCYVFGVREERVVCHQVIAKEKEHLSYSVEDLGLPLGVGIKGVCGRPHIVFGDEAELEEVVELYVQRQDGIVMLRSSKHPDFWMDIYLA